MKKREQRRTVNKNKNSRCQTDSTKRVKVSGANGSREKAIVPAQLTTSRIIDNHMWLVMPRLLILIVMEAYTGIFITLDARSFPWSRGSKGYELHRKQNRTTYDRRYGPRALFLV